jgi:uncharacterized protein YqeY
MIADVLQEHMKDALRSGEKDRLRTIRSLRADLQQAAIEHRQSGGELSDADELKVLQKAAKQRKDAIAQYEDAGREDLAAKESAELEVIQSYLPEQLSDEALRAQLQDIVDATGASSMQDMGHVMGQAMQQLRGKADGARISTIVKELLS